METYSTNTSAIRRVVKSAVHHAAGGIAVALSLLLLWACGPGSTPVAVRPDLPTAEYVSECYDKYLKGDYEAFVSDMASCDSMPEDYRRQMMYLYKQHASEMRRKNGGAVRASVVRMEPHNDSTMVNVFFNVVYADSSAEEIMVPFVYVADRWRLQ